MKIFHLSFIIIALPVIDQMKLALFFHLENYQDVYNNRSLITYVIGGGDDLRHGNPMMPPWPPDRQFSTLLDERYLEDEEIDLIVSWVESGAIQGDPTLEYPMPEFPDGFCNWRARFNF